MNNNHFFHKKSPFEYSTDRRRFLGLSVSFTVGSLIPTSILSKEKTFNKQHTFNEQRSFKQQQISLTHNPLGYKGYRRDLVTNGYPLGKGYRIYNPRIIRFHATDSMSPFGRGGINSYSYCMGDPINRKDPSGHFFLLSLLISAIIGAVIGAIIGAIAEGIRSAATGTPFDWKAVAIGAATGFISGGFGAAASGTMIGVKIGLALISSSVQAGATWGIYIASGASNEEAAIAAGITLGISLAAFGVGQAVTKAGKALAPASARLKRIITEGMSGRGARKAALTLKIDTSHKQLLDDGVVFVHGSNNSSFEGLTRFRAILTAEEIDATPWFHRVGLRSGERGYTFQSIGTNQPIAKGVSLNGASNYKGSLHYAAYGDSGNYPVLYGINGKVTLSSANVGHPLSVGGINLDYIHRIYAPAQYVEATTGYFKTRGFERLADSVRALPS